MEVSSHALELGRVAGIRFACRVFTNLNLAETMVVFLGDNGTPTEVVQLPYDQFHCKGTLFEGGVRIPMFIAGAGVVGTNRETTAVVHAVDLFACGRSCGLVPRRSRSAPPPRSARSPPR